MTQTICSEPDVSGYVVRPLALCDAEDWVEYAGLPEAMRFSRSSVITTEDLRGMIERSLSDEADAPILFGVRQPDTNILVATFGFHTVSSHNRTGEITYDVRPQCWGRGIATDLCRAAVRWAFQEKRWVRVQATTLEENVASRRVLEKCRFEFEALLHSYRLFRGKPKDYLMFSRSAPP
jgi:RimJ/RimL family protein N-acetyltransferase